MRLSGLARRNTVANALDGRDRGKESFPERFEDASDGTGWARSTWRLHTLKYKQDSSPVGLLEHAAQQLGLDLQVARCYPPAQGTRYPTLWPYQVVFINSCKPRAIPHDCSLGMNNASDYYRAQITHLCIQTSIHSNMRPNTRATPSLQFVSSAFTLEQICLPNISRTSYKKHQISKTAYLLLTGLVKRAQKQPAHW